MTWIQTREGYKFDLLQPNSAAIEIETIAVVLSRTCRFGGHSREFYSNAQHSCIVANLVNEPELKLPALLHDAHEVYSGFGDVLRPAKNLNPIVREYIRNTEREIDMQIATRFGFRFDLFQRDSIKHADNVALTTEARDVMCNPPEPWEELPPATTKRTIEPWDQDKAMHEFLSAFERYDSAF